MIRNFQNMDLDKVMQIWLDSNIQAHNFIPSDYWYSNCEAVRMMLPGTDVYVYESEEGILGFAGIAESYIEGIFIKALHRSCGIGRLLLDYLKEYHAMLFLNVYTKNTRAISFYLREGFTAISEQVDTETEEYEITMKWTAAANKILI